MPVLKSKHGEFLGLSKLADDIREKVVPLIEITPKEWSAEGKTPKTIEDHLDIVCKRYIKNWNSSKCFIDTYLMKRDNEDNSPMIEYFLSNLRSKNLVPLPVIHVNSSNAYIEAIKRIRVNLGIMEVGIRIVPDELSSPEFAENLTSLLRKIAQTPSACHLIFDLVSSNFSDIDNLSEGIIGIIETFPSLKEWQSFTIAGSAFPASRAVKKGVSEFERNDWNFHKKFLGVLKEKSFKRLINFGDYSIINPGYFEFDPKKMKPSANIRYTLDTRWVIAKGSRLAEAEDYAQYKSLARSIARSDYFLGANFSEGDRYISQCARGVVPPGQPRTWVWVGHCHHITKTVQNLFSSFAVP